MDRVTGKWIDGDTHLQQSIEDTMMTRKGERVLVRDYGMDQQLVDAPMSPSHFMLWAYASVEAFDRANEPRVEMTQINVTRVSKQGELDLTMQLTLNPEPNLVGAIRSEYERAGMTYDLAEPVVTPISIDNLTVTTPIIS